MGSYPLSSAYLPAGGVPGGTQSQGGDDSSSVGSLAEVMRQIAQDDAPVQRRSMKISGDLDAVVGSLGKVTVRGDAQIAQGGQFRSGQSGYDSGTGFFLDYNGGTPRLSLGNSSGNKLTWDGTNLTITGGITATSGSIGGWTIGATTLTGGSITLDSAGNIRAGQTAYDTGTGFFLGVVSGTPKLSVGNASGKKLTWDGTDLHITGTVTFISTGTFGDAVTWQVSGTTKGSIYADATHIYFAYGPAAASGAALTLDGTNWTLGDVGANTLKSVSSPVVVQASGGFAPGGQATGYIDWDSGNTRLRLRGAPTEFTHALYPGGSGTTGTGFLDWDSANARGRWNSTNFHFAANVNVVGFIQFNGAIRTVSDNGTDISISSPSLVIAGNASQPGLKFDNIANGGSATNWSGFTVANIPDKSAGYIKIAIAGTNYRVPIYADA